MQLVFHLPSHVPYADNPRPHGPKRDTCESSRGRFLSVQSQRFLIPRHIHRNFTLRLQLASCPRALPHTGAPIGVGIVDFLSLLKAGDNLPSPRTWKVWLFSPL
jgi:hypothetical protein